MRITKISFQRLIKKAIKNNVEFFILLNGGLKSSKVLSRNGDEFYLYNEIDSSEEFFATEQELKDYLKTDNFYMYIW